MGNLRKNYSKFIFHKIRYLSKQIYVPFFLGMIMYANEFETKRKQKWTEKKNLTATYTSVFCRHESLQKFKFYFLVFFKIQWTFILFFERREFNPLSTQEYKKPVQYTILGEIPTFLCRHCSRLPSPDLQLKYIWRWRTCHIFVKSCPSRSNV